MEDEAAHIVVSSCQYFTAGSLYCTSSYPDSHRYYYNDTNINGYINNNFDSHGYNYTSSHDYTTNYNTNHDHPDYHPAAYWRCRGAEQQCLHHREFIPP